MRKRPGAALLRSIAQRSDPSPLSSVRVTRSSSGMGGAGVAIWAKACVGSAKSATAPSWPKAAKARGKRLGNYSKHGLTDQPDRRLIAVIAVSTDDTWASHPENNMTAYENRLIDSSHRRIFFCDPRNLVGRRLLSLKSGLWRPRPPAASRQILKTGLIVAWPGFVRLA